MWIDAMITIKSHIRALAFRNPILLAGIGSFIQVWHLDQFNQFQSLNYEQSLLEDIDGIKFIQSNDRLEEAESFQFVIYSVRFVQFCKIRFEKNLNPSNIEIIKEQKIHSFYRTLDLASVPLALSDQTTQQLFIWINSRNEIIEFDSLNEGPKSKIYGPRKCILYAAKFLSITSEYSIVASGTVFKEIIIWSLEFESLKVTELQVLQGHDGIIFDLQYNAQFNLLISVSDDRSLRIWSDHRIGFCPQSFRDWASNRFESKQIYYGHEEKILILLHGH
ncbi:hypothetical protein SSS_01241 [Sarcoptes scabiei]|nr:hypothetical protein SSS_01241 [Sarcoptes scabiei]